MGGRLLMSQGEVLPVVLRPFLQMYCVVNYIEGWKISRKKKKKKENHVFFSTTVGEVDFSMFRVPKIMLTSTMTEVPDVLKL